MMMLLPLQFDYSFWKDSNMTNWGNEFWCFIKVDGRWKITGIVYS